MVSEPVEVFKGRRATRIVGSGSANVGMKIPEQGHSSQLQSSRVEGAMKILHAVEQTGRDSSSIGRGRCWYDKHQGSHKPSETWRLWFSG